MKKEDDILFGSAGEKRLQKEFNTEKQALKFYNN
jgi:hypothetical protein